MRQTTLNLLNKETKVNSAAAFAGSLRGYFGASPACEREKINRRVAFLRRGLGFIYLWFGALKFFPALSSAEHLAGTTIEMMSFGFLTPDLSLPLLALWETAIGLALLSGKLLRIALFSLYFHVAGTLAPLFLLPAQTWTMPPFAASLEGQYIFKNLVTIGAALVIDASEGCRD